MWHILHSWSNWKTIEEGKLTQIPTWTARPIRHGNYIVQVREYSKCKKAELRTVRTY